MALIRNLLLTVFALTSALAHAQFDACPGGVQVGRNCGGGVCQPICQYDNAPQSQSGTRAAQTRIVDRYQVWDDRWGALARDEQGPLGVSEGQLTKEDAERAASADCVKRGGDLHRCQQIRQTYRNSCVAYAWGGGGSSIYMDPNGVEAEAKAVEDCSKTRNASCRVVYSGCSLPVERWTYEKPPGWVPAE